MGLLISFSSCVCWQAARLTAAARQFKQKCLHIRVFGYPSASQLDLDSFVLFSHSAEMKVGQLLYVVLSCHHSCQNIFYNLD